MADPDGLGLLRCHCVDCQGRGSAHTCLRCTNAQRAGGTLLFSCIPSAHAPAVGCEARGSSNGVARVRAPAQPVHAPTSPMCPALSLRMQVQGQSMQPTLNNDPEQSDWVLVEKISAKWLKKYQRGSVVVLWCACWPRQMAETTAPVPPQCRECTTRAVLKRRLMCGQYCALSITQLARALAQAAAPACPCPHWIAVPVYHRAPDSPHQQLIKRIIGVEGDYVRETGKKEPTHIRQVRGYTNNAHSWQQCVCVCVCPRAKQTGK